MAAVTAARRVLPDIALRYRTLLGRLGPALDGPGRLTEADAWYFILAQNALISELETPPEPGDTAAIALRARIRARFAELETEHASLTAQTAALDAQTTAADDSSLLDALPIVAARLDQAPAELQHALYQACDLQLLYNRDMDQVTIWVTITDTTPTTIADILNASEDPARSDSPQPPIGARN